MGSAVAVPKSKKNLKRNVSPKSRNRKENCPSGLSYPPDVPCQPLPVPWAGKAQIQTIQLSIPENYFLSLHQPCAFHQADQRRSPSLSVCAHVAPKRLRRIYTARYLLCPASVLASSISLLNGQRGGCFPVGTCTKPTCQRLDPAVVLTPAGSSPPIRRANLSATRPRLPPGRFGRQGVGRAGPGSFHRLRNLKEPASP